jgi:hypothetical protein
MGAEDCVEDGDCVALLVVLELLHVVYVDVGGEAVDEAARDGLEQRRLPRPVDAEYGAPFEALDDQPTISVGT